MIRSICFNPVIDRVYHIDDFETANKFKEISPLICPAGKGVNIARVASQLDEECTLYSFIGGYGGRLLRKEMERLNVDFQYCEIEDDTRTTINIIDRKNRKETEITEAGGFVNAAQEKQLLEMLESDIRQGDIVICSGIPMRGMQRGVFKLISQWCYRENAKCILDTNSHYIAQSLPAHLFLMKPNLSELCEMFSIDAIEDDGEIISLSKEVFSYGVENLMVSTGRSGGLFFNKDVSLRITVPDELINSTIGSGDSTVAGFSIALNRGCDLHDCLKFAMACGVCNAMFPQVGYVEKELVEKIMKKIIVQDI